jgi:hypothetical protein
MVLRDESEFSSAVDLHMARPFLKESENFFCSAGVELRTLCLLRQALCCLSLLRAVEIANVESTVNTQSFTTG